MFCSVKYGADRTLTDPTCKAISSQHPQPPPRSFSCPLRTQNPATVQPTPPSTKPTETHRSSLYNTTYSTSPSSQISPLHHPLVIPRRKCPVVATTEAMAQKRDLDYFHRFDREKQRLRHDEFLPANLSWGGSRTSIVELWEQLATG